jgi:hypothetical protein
MGRAVLPLLMMTCAVVVGSCETGSKDSWNGAVRDSGGIQIVENYGAPLWRQGEGWTFTKVLRVGVRDGDPRYQLNDAVIPNRCDLWLRRPVETLTGVNGRWYNHAGISTTESQLGSSQNTVARLSPSGILAGI